MPNWIELTNGVNRMNDVARRADHRCRRARTGFLRRRVGPKVHTEECKAIRAFIDASYEWLDAAQAAERGSDPSAFEFANLLFEDMTTKGRAYFRVRGV